MVKSAELGFELRRDNEGAVIVVTGEVDFHTCEQFYLVSKAYLKESDKRVIFDLSELKFLDTEGWKVLGHCLKDIGEKEVEVVHQTYGPSKIIENFGPDFQHIFPQLTFRRLDSHSNN